MDLVLVDEYSTTKVDWETTLPKLKIYRTSELIYVVGIPNSKQLSLKAMPFIERSAHVIPDQYKEAV